MTSGELGNLYTLLRGKERSMDSTVKPGWKTTEFWLSLIATLIGALLASGALNPTDPTQGKILQIVGLISTLLASMGYTAARTSAKNAQARTPVITVTPGDSNLPK